jgi:HAE1 family hydrophobic/amphiphilic exporter-1
VALFAVLPIVTTCERTKAKEGAPAPPPPAVIVAEVTRKTVPIVAEFEQYPFLAPPTIRVTATYPGASAVAVEQSVATPIEQEVNGVDRMIYMQSSNTSDGRMLLDVNFEVGVNQDTANVLTQNRVASAQARLPQEVNAQGVTVKKQSPSILMLISVASPGGATTRTT